MKSRYFKYLIPALLITLIGVSDAIAQKKRAQTTMKFLSAPLSARASAMGDALTAVEGGSSSIFYNPAGAAWFTDTYDASVGMVSWIEDINYSYASILYRPANGLYGVIGFSIMSVDYGEMLETVYDARNVNQQKAYIELGTFRPNALATGLTYARAISNQFSVGANFRYVNLNLGSFATGIVSGTGNEIIDPEYMRTSFEKSTYTVDFGVFYKTGLESLNFAMSVRNYSREVQYIEDNQELPLTFRMGVSMNVLDFTSIDPNTHKFYVNIDANRPRDYYEQLLIGGEYVFINRLALRAGYMFPHEEQGVSFGVGVIQPLRRFGLKVDYSYTSFGIFNSVNRFALQMNFN